MKVYSKNYNLFRIEDKVADNVHEQYFSFYVYNFILGKTSKMYNLYSIIRNKDYIIIAFENS